jgi:hypothetical protein
MEDPPVVIPDAGPWITLAYADALDLLLKPGWPVAIERRALLAGREFSRLHFPND